MLSKSNKMLIGCLALLLAMSVGYALFSDTITVNGSATAKGDFNLVTTCDMDVSTIGEEEIGSVTDAKISCEGNVVNASATLEYPGSQKWFRVMVKNEGTISARLKEVVELNSPEIMYYKKDEGWSGYEIENCQGDNTNKACSKLVMGTNIYMDYEGPDEGIEVDWSQLDSDPTLDPGETAYFYINMEWFANSTTPGEPLTPTLNAELTWEQVTE